MAVMSFAAPRPGSTDSGQVCDTVVGMSVYSHATRQPMLLEFGARFHVRATTIVWGDAGKVCRRTQWRHGQYEVRGSVMFVTFSCKLYPKFLVLHKFEWDATHKVWSNDEVVLEDVTPVQFHRFTQKYPIVEAEEGNSILVDSASDAASACELQESFQ